MFEQLKNSLFSVLIPLIVFLGLKPVMAEIPSHGSGWNELESRIIQKIEKEMEDNNIPGMTVAVSKDGRMVLNKGYGLARASGKAVPMKNFMRTKIGSVTKAAITGPTAFKMMEEQGINRKTKRLFFGSNSVFKNTLNSYIFEGRTRFSPIAATAINAQDRVISWYTNGEYSVGTSWDLDYYETQKPFKIPEGKLLTDIRDIGITKDNKVYAWYNDGSRSIGTYNDLGNISVDSEGNPLKVKFPSGKSMLNVVGIAITKSNSHVYVWYDDGTLSSGYSLNFGYYFKNKNYTLKGGTPYHIRNMGIASDDHIYTWLSNGKVQSGYSRNLAYYKQPYWYTHPYIDLTVIGADTYKWYDDITIQDILHHKAGFLRSEDIKGTQEMFSTDDENTTFLDVVKHFLKTRPLKWSPGGSYLYSNFGFGLWGAIFPALTGQSFEEYAINYFLEPLGLVGDVRISTPDNDMYDSCAHQYINNEFKVIPDGESRWNPAGGWKASAGSLLRITNHLTNKYSTSELKDMGWGVTSSGIASHNGAITGGMSYVAMFPNGYHSVVTGGDLSNVHIALAANRWSDVGSLMNLANEIAREVPESNIPDDYEVGKIIFNTRIPAIDCN